MAAIKFSKKSVIEALRQRGAILQEKWGFDPNNGTAQLSTPTAVANTRDHRKDRAVAYGEWNFCMNLATWIEEGQFPFEDLRGQGITGTL